MFFSYNSTFIIIYMYLLFLFIKRCTTGYFLKNLCIVTNVSMHHINIDGYVFRQIIALKRKYTIRRAVIDPRILSHCTALFPERK